MPTIPFTPPHVSINRVMIADLPGVAADQEVLGHIAYRLLSLQALTDYVQARAGDLGIPDQFWADPTVVRVKLPRLINQCLSSSDPQVAQTAQQIGRRLGRNLGHILLTLQRGDTVNQQARPDWTSAEWEHWRSIRQVWLAGGLINGDLGGLIIKHAQAFLDEVGWTSHLKIACSPLWGNPALLGAACYLPSTTQQAICLDCGHTLVKRACVTLENGTIQDLHTFEARPVDWEKLGEPGEPNPQRGQATLDFVTEIISQTRAEALTHGFKPGREMMLCVAAYVEGGHLLGNGIYAQMMSLADDARPLLANAIRAQTGEPAEVFLIHDGTAAAALHAGEADTAVILAGTALGVGFPPPNDADLRPLGAGLSPSSQP